MKKILLLFACFSLSAVAAENALSIKSEPPKKFQIPEIFADFAEANKKSEAPKKESDGGIISISMDDPNKNDLSWGASAEIGGIDPAPQSAIILPFLPTYPIENIEIKLRLFKEKF
jgi:hypothetical protein